MVQKNVTLINIVSSSGGIISDDVRAAVRNEELMKEEGSGVGVKEDTPK